MLAASRTLLKQYDCSPVSHLELGTSLDFSFPINATLLADAEDKDYEVPLNKETVSSIHSLYGLQHLFMGLACQYETHLGLATE